MSSASTIRPLTRLIPAQRTSDGAGVTLYRSLGQSPFARLDPFLMLDEFGSERPDEYIAGFPAHPHRGFQTVTYMLEGHMLHEDHLGNRGHLRSGGVQWMTAGRGIIHSEMPQQESGRMRGFQLWINLPAREKLCPPAYRDLEASEIPVCDAVAGLRVKVIAGLFECEGTQIRGSIDGLTTEPVFLDVHLSSARRFHQTLPSTHQVFVYVYEGELALADSQGISVTVPARYGAVMGEGERLTMQAGAFGARCLLLAAKPLGEPVVQYGPFVMNTREEIEQAIRDYQRGTLAG